MILFNMEEGYGFIKKNSKSAARRQRMGEL